jgi:hypothetical protein
MRGGPDAKRRDEGFRRRYLSGFRGLVFDANRGSPQPLQDYLLSGALLSPDDRDDLAWLISRHVPKVGRDAGATSKYGDPLIIQKQCAASLVRIERDRLRASTGDKKLPFSITQALAKRAIELTIEHFPDARDKIKLADIIGSPERKKHGQLNWKPSLAVKTYVQERMRVAIRRMEDVIEVVPCKLGV